MNLPDFEIIVDEKFKEFKLDGYSFMWDRAKVRRGRHWGSKKLITMSSWCVINRKPEHSINTLLHEIAHAIAYIKYGRSQKHNKFWKEIAISRGVNLSI